MKLRCGDSFTRCCSTAWVKRTASTGSGPRSTRRVYPLPGGEKTGPNPTDRSKQGSKRHIMVDKGGVPLAVRHAAANTHDSTLFEEMVDAIEPIRRPRGRPRRRPQKLHADKAYDAKKCREVLRRRGIKARMARSGKDSSEKLGQYRWVVERTLSWLNRYRRLEGGHERGREGWGG